jgi:hypothetical protein
VDTGDKLMRGADAGQGEFEDALWGVVAHAMTHQPKGERLSLAVLLDPATFDRSLLPVIRRAWQRTVEAVSLESLVEHGHPMPDPRAGDTDPDAAGEDG